MNQKENNVEVLSKAMELIRQGVDMLDQLKRPLDEKPVAKFEVGPWTGPGDLAYNMAKDTQIDMMTALEHLESSRGLFAGVRGFNREAEKYLRELDQEFGEEPDLDLDEVSEYDPLVFPDYVAPEDMEIIRELAKTERDHRDLTKHTDITSISDFLNLDEVTGKKVDKLMKRGQELRDALMSGPLANVMLDFVDDVKDLKKMAATMFFLYAAERQSAEHEDRDPDEDFFYAGLNLYKYAVVEQISAEDDDDDDFEDLEEDAWDDDEDDE